MGFRMLMQNESDLHLRHSSIRDFGIQQVWLVYVPSCILPARQIDDYYGDETSSSRRRALSSSHPQTSELKSQSKTTNACFISIVIMMYCGGVSGWINSSTSSSFQSYCNRVCCVGVYYFALVRSQSR